MTEKKSDLHETIEHLKQMRDELQLKIQLGSMEARDEFHQLEQQWKEFSDKAELEKTSDGVSSALSLLGEELKAGYHRIKKGL